MPELPEVECVRRSLERHVLGRPVASVRVSRSDVIRGSARPAALLAGDRVAAVLRHGKQLAVVGEKGRCVCVHLGMSGQLCILDPTHDPARLMQHKAGPSLPPHTHVLWRLDNGLLLRFTDPRRFGGLWTFDRLDALHAQRWAALGPDALSATPVDLHRRLRTTTRGLKAALLDQNLLAGLGNIYVDELLFACRLHPLLTADRLDKRQTAGLVRRMRSLLAGSIERGGSSLRDYVDADNRKGSQQDRHRVYGREGQRCHKRACRATIVSDQVAGRTTAWCPRCQALPG